MEQGANWHKSLRVSDNSPGESPAGLSSFPRSISLIYSHHYPGNPPPLQRHSAESPGAAFPHPSATGPEVNPTSTFPPREVSRVSWGTWEETGGGFLWWPKAALGHWKRTLLMLFGCVLVANPRRTGVPVQGGFQVLPKTGNADEHRAEEGPELSGRNSRFVLMFTVPR